MTFSIFVLEMNQADVAVNPGNSGGPLFNMWGSVVGFNSMIASQSGGFEGISMSVPSSDIILAMLQIAIDQDGFLPVGRQSEVVRARDFPGPGVHVFLFAPAKTDNASFADILQVAVDQFVGQFAPVFCTHRP